MLIDKKEGNIPESHRYIKIVLTNGNAYNYKYMEAHSKSTTLTALTYKFTSYTGY